MIQRSDQNMNKSSLHLRSWTVYLVRECRLVRDDTAPRERPQVSTQARSFPRQKPTNSVYSCCSNCSYLQPKPYNRNRARYISPTCNSITRYNVEHDRQKQTENIQKERYIKWSINTNLKTGWTKYERMPHNSTKPSIRLNNRVVLTQQFKQQKQYIHYWYTVHTLLL